MKKKDTNKDEDIDLSIGGVAIGEHMRANSLWGKIGTIAAVVAAISSVITLIITILR